MFDVAELETMDPDLKALIKQQNIGSLVLRYPSEPPFWEKNPEVGIMYSRNAEHNALLLVNIYLKRHCRHTKREI